MNPIGGAPAFPRSSLTGVTAGTDAVAPTADGDEVVLDFSPLLSGSCVVGKIVDCGLRGNHKSKLFPLLKG